jgi:hypothetical protein
LAKWKKKKRKKKKKKEKEKEKKRKERNPGHYPFYSPEPFSFGHFWEKS